MYNNIIEKTKSTPEAELSEITSLPLPRGALLCLHFSKIQLEGEQDEAMGYNEVCAVDGFLNVKTEDGIWRIRIETIQEKSDGKFFVEGTCGFLKPNEALENISFKRRVSLVIAIPTELIGQVKAGIVRKREDPIQAELVQNPMPIDPNPYASPRGVGEIISANRSSWLHVVRDLFR